MAKTMLFVKEVTIVIQRIMLLQNFCSACFYQPALGRKFVF